MPIPAIELAGLRAVIATNPPGSERKLALIIEGGSVRLSPAGIALLLPPGLPVELDAIRNGKLVLGGEVMGVAYSADVLPEATVGGRLRLRITAVRAAGFIPLPADTVASFVMTRIPNKPGLHVVSGTMLEIDAVEIGQHFGIELPTLKRVGVGVDYADLHF